MSHVLPHKDAGQYEREFPCRDAFHDGQVEQPIGGFSPRGNGHASAEEPGVRHSKERARRRFDPSSSATAIFEQANREIERFESPQLDQRRHRVLQLPPRKSSGIGGGVDSARESGSHRRSNQRLDAVAVVDFEQIDCGGSANRSCNCRGSFLGQTESTGKVVARAARHDAEGYLGFYQRRERMMDEAVAAHRYDSCWFRPQNRSNDIGWAISLDPFDLVAQRHQLVAHCVGIARTPSRCRIHQQVNGGINEVGTHEPKLPRLIGVVSLEQPVRYGRR